MAQTSVTGYQYVKTCDLDEAISELDSWTADDFLRNMIVIEICCGSDSALGRKSNMLDFTLVIRVTKKHDFRSKAVVDKVLKCIRSRNLHVWYSSPCTGGCSFNVGINWTKSQDNEHTRELILSHWKDHDLSIIHIYEPTRPY